jgi:26S proteasome non-ATPase regulatory subunit 10
LKAGAETDKKNMDGFLAIELAPDSQVGADPHLGKEQTTLTWKVRKFILQTAEQEGVEL